MEINKEYAHSCIKYYVKFLNGKIKITFKRRFKSGAPIPCDDVYYPNKPVYLSICSIFKDEAPYLKEWIEYHLLAGVERFYLYDNDSTDNPLEILQPYIDKGVVIYHKIPGSEKQYIAYRDAIYKYKKQTYWMAIIHLDEFIVPVEKDDIKEFLKDYEKYPGVVINWELFDSNGHKTKPNCCIIEAYTRILKSVQDPKFRIHIKSIIRPVKVESVISAHFALFRHKEEPVYANFVKLPRGMRGVIFNYNESMSKIKINHYYTKSEEEYLKRCSRNWPNMNEKRPIIKSLINFIDETEEDLTIQKYLPKLKERLKN